MISIIILTDYRLRNKAKKTSQTSY